MVDNISAGEQNEDFGRETLQLRKDLERMTEQMENISVHLTWMAYDLVVLRTDPQLAISLRKLEDEYLQCKAVILGAIENMEKMEKDNVTVVTASKTNLDYKLIQLESIAESLNHMEVKIQMLQCNLTMCFSHPDKAAHLLTDGKDSRWLTEAYQVEQ